MSAFPTTFDHSFIDTTRIFVVGNGEAPVPDSELLTPGGLPGPQATNDPTQLVSHPGGTLQWFIFTDKVSGKTYAAQAVPQVADGSGTTTYRNDTGVRMLETALTLESQMNTLCGADPTSPGCSAKTQALQKFQENVDVMRSLHNAFGYASYKTDAPFYY